MTQTSSAQRSFIDLAPGGNCTRYLVADQELGCENDPKVNLRKWLEDDRDIVKRIGDAGGIISDMEIQSHIQNAIPMSYKTYIGQMNDSVKLSSNGNRVLSTQEIVDLLRARYLFLHPELPPGTSTNAESKKPQSPSKSVDPAKDPRNVALEASSSTSPSGKKPVSMKTQCYNCKSYGHFSRDCPSPRDESGGGGSNGKKSKGRKNGNGLNAGNGSNVQNTPQQPFSTPSTFKPSTTTTPSQSSTQLRTNSNSKSTGQAGMVEDIDYVYMAESTQASDDDWSDNEDDEIPVPLSPLFLNGRLPSEEKISSFVDSVDTEEELLTSEELENVECVINGLGNDVDDVKLRLVWQTNRERRNLGTRCRMMVMMIASRRMRVMRRIPKSGLSRRELQLTAKTYTFISADGVIVDAQ
ncbi:hypothetical protein D9758_004927 [Tetrapyrgos nigripes]|uniref:CCHC-type domain-containing protein n=1 Tax=Tetrapyrgos nigripes TaxID=182062 RepID=A0A8H5GWH5_9AGAR|nr:hypothetical protein D9758_004927 [Tetrapyrgos nigripes]